MSAFPILRRRRELVNTDPQRRCYNGAHFSSKWRWTAWEELERTTPEKAEPRLQFWRELNDYAVSARGKGAKRQFKLGEAVT